MPDDISQWVAKNIAAKIERLRAGNKLTKEQLRKSYRQLAFSKELLRLPVPKTWHSEMPSDDPATHAER
jgi:hypothetical protein